MSAYRLCALARFWLVRSFVRSFLLVADSLYFARAIAATAMLASGCASSHGRDELDAVGPRDAFAAEVGALDAPRDGEPDPPDATRDVERDPPDAPSCSAEVCDGIDQDCDGLVDDGVACTIPGGSAACIDGACRFVACDGTHADCDDDGTDGCEVALHDDRENCSACGVVCGMTERCEAGTCVRERIVDVAPGGLFSCALLGSGRVLCWGTNEYGSLGPEYPSAGSSVPVEVHGLPPDLISLADSVAASGFAITAAGELWGWGSNADGELGVGVMTHSPLRASLVSLPRPVASVHTASSSTCAVDIDGTAWCWGDYAGSEPGMGHPIPTRVELGGPVEILAGGFASAWFAQTERGRFTWGQGAFGIHGAGPVTAEDRPVTPFAALEPVRAVSCSAHCCAVLATGGVTCWGADFSGGLGDGLPDDADWDYVGSGYHDPVTNLSSPGAVEVVAIGRTDADIGGCARYSDDHVECWGGLLASGLGRPSSTPLTMDPGGPVTAVYGGDGTGCVRVRDTQLRCWGRNDWGELGDGSIGRPSPVPVSVVGFE